MITPDSIAPATIRVSEIFLSLQGEGPSAGTPAHFLRLQGCSVGCHWCDTKYSWDSSAGREMAIHRAYDEARALGDAPMLVITGGEPLEHPGVERVIEAGLEQWDRVEIETSGASPPPLRHTRLFYNVSPKLPSVTPRWADTWRNVFEWTADPQATFKIVIGNDPDAADAQRLIDAHRIPASRVMLMPEGITDEQLRARAGAVAELCKDRGYRMSPRLHVWMWGARRGV